MAKFIGFKEEAEQLKFSMKKEVNVLRKSGITPHLIVFLVGDNKASEIYVRNKEKFCNEVGVDITVIRFSENVDQCTLLEKILIYNNELCDGILVQLPLPNHINKDVVVSAISPAKDVDCFTPYRLGKLCLPQPEDLVPPTSNAVLYAINFVGVNLKGKHAVIINDTIVLGRPLAYLLLNRDATVTICNAYTRNIQEICNTADIVVTAVGKQPDFIFNNKLCKKDAIVIDVGINNVNGKVLGDVDINNIDNASVVTKVPGGVGILTIVFLVQNIIKIAKLRLLHTPLGYGQM